MVNSNRNSNDRQSRLKSVQCVKNNIQQTKSKINCKLTFYKIVSVCNPNFLFRREILLTHF